MSRNPDANSLNKPSVDLRPPESDPQWSQAASQAAPLLPPPELVWLCFMLSTDYGPGCHFHDYGTDDCYVADPTDPTYPTHCGIDMIDSADKPVYAGAPGKVLAIVNNDAADTFGRLVWVRHSDKTHSRIIDSYYGHMTPDPGLVVGQNVTTDTQLGTVYNGITGFSTGSHLHFGIIVHDCANPDNGWEAAELANSEPFDPAVASEIFAWGAGNGSPYAVDPLDFVTCSKFCCDDDIGIAAAWIPFGQVPLSSGGAGATCQSGLCQGEGTGVQFEACFHAAAPLQTVRPMFDAPAGKMRVIASVNSGLLIEGFVILDHGAWRGKTILSCYRAFYGGFTAAVAVGQWIDLSTTLGTMTHPDFENLLVRVGEVPSGADIPTTLIEWAAADINVCPQTYHPAAYLKGV